MGCSQTGGICCPQKISPDAVHIISAPAKVNGHDEKFLKDDDNLFQYSNKPKEIAVDQKSKSKKSHSQNKVKPQDEQASFMTKSKSKSELNQNTLNSGLSLQLKGSTSQQTLHQLGKQNTKGESPESIRTQAGGQFTISINSGHQLQSLISPPSIAHFDEQMSMTKNSFKSSGGQSNNSNQQQENPVFYESEYFYSSMPASLPSDFKGGKSIIMIGEQRPYTPTSNQFQSSPANRLSLDQKSYQSSQYSSIIQMSQYSTAKQKLQNIDLDEVIKNYPRDEDVDSSLPKYFKFNISKLYKYTGLPQPARKAKDDEKEVFMVQNLFRVYKRFLVQVLEEHVEYLKKSMQGNNRYDNLQVTKKEGISAVMDAIDFVKKCPMLKPFYWNKLLSKVSRIHADECSKHNYVSHKSRKGQKPSQRMRKYGHVLFGGAQNIFNGSKSGIESVLNLIIDDGVSTRGHRKNILMAAHRTVGTASEPHPSMGTIIVSNYAFHYCHIKHAEPMRKIVDDWLQEDLSEVVRNMKIVNGDNYKYQVAFSYPFLVKTTIIAKEEKDGTMKPIQNLHSQKNIEEILYNEKQ